MVVSVQSHDIMEFVSVRENRRALHQIDGSRGYTEMANSLLSYAHNGGRVLFAVDDGVLAGCFGYSPVTATAGCYSPEFVAELGEGARPVFRHNIWVRPEYRGQGLSLKLFEHSVADGRGRGYTHSVGFMPETDAIAKWAMALPGVYIMSAKDKNGGQIVAKAF
jgi:GNAT superfamily N-acetyltransferase